MKKPLSLREGNEGEPEGNGRGKEGKQNKTKKNRHKKACFAVLVNH